MVIWHHTERRWGQLKGIAILGCTGSIGSQTLSVLNELRDFKVVGLAARSNWQAALSQAREYKVPVLALEDPSAARMAASAKNSLGMEGLEVLSGPEGAARIASLPDADVVVHAIPGLSGIKPLLAALGAGKRVAFAGKESLVSAGELVLQVLSAGRGQLIPVDSEHSAIFQCLIGEDPSEVDEIVLTASGGALRDVPLDQMDRVTPAQVMAHPTWRMGPKVTVDSATLFNKALEVMEAHFLFRVGYDRIRVVIHRESIVHAMVTFRDGSTKAHAARPDMRLCIAYALTYPRRPAGAVEALKPYRGVLTFDEPDPLRYPCLELGYRAGMMGGTAPCVISYADEILVGEFLRGRIPFSSIARTLSILLDEYTPRQVTGVEVLQEEAARIHRRLSELLF